MVKIRTLAKEKTEGKQFGNNVFIYIFKLFCCL